MSNPLIDLQKLVDKGNQKSFTAKVVSISGQKIKVQLAAGNTLIVWGVAQAGDTVLIVGKQIIAIIGEEKRKVVYIS